VCDVLIGFYRVLCTKGYIYLRVFEQLVYFLPYFFAAIRKSAPLCLVVLGIIVFIFVLVVVVVVFQLRLRSMFLIGFLCVCFDFLVTGCVCNLFSR
jgi:hypothetical protein